MSRFFSGASGRISNDDENGIKASITPNPSNAYHEDDKSTSFKNIPNTKTIKKSTSFNQIPQYETIDNKNDDSADFFTEDTDGNDAKIPEESGDHEVQEVSSLMVPTSYLSIPYSR